MSLFDDIPLTPQRFPPHALRMPESNVMSDDRNYQMRRSSIIANWQAAFDASRKENKPPKYEVQQVEAVNLVLAGILMYNSIPEPNPTLRMQRFLDTMDVGGYRMGRTRMGTPWASVFIRNIQYSMGKYVPNNVRFPELTLLGLAIRPNMQKFHEFMHRDMRMPTFVDRLAANGCRVNFLRQPNSSLMMLTDYLQFTHSIELGELEAYFNRRFDRNFLQYLEATRNAPGNVRMPSPFPPPDFDGDVMVLMEE